MYYLLLNPKMKLVPCWKRFLLLLLLLIPNLNLKSPLLILLLNMCLSPKTKMKNLV
jgi:hypothetical protein